MIKAVFFDFFGVVFSNTLGLWLDSKGLEKTDKIADLCERSDLGEITSDEFFTALATECDTTAEAILSEFQQFAAFNAEVVEVIKRLRSSYVVGLITNSSVGYVHDQLKVFELEQLFDHIVISAEFGAIKPQPEIFTEALRQADVEPVAAVFIDDKPYNVAGAEKLGLRGIEFVDTGQLETELSRLGVRIN